MNISSKLKYIQEFMSTQEISVITDVSSRYLRYVKEGKRSGKGIKSKVDTLYTTFHNLEKRSYVRRRLSEKEKDRLISLNKFKKIKVRKKKVSQHGNKVTDIEVDLNMSFTSDKLKYKIMNILYKVLKNYKFNGLFQFYTFSTMGQEVVFTPLQVSDLETFTVQFEENFIDESEFAFYAGYKEQSSLNVINKENVILRVVKLRLMVYP